MKKLTAAIMAMIMLLTAQVSVMAANNNEAAQPGIKVYTSAVPKESGDVTFEVKLTDFSAVKGMKLTLTSENGVTFKNITGNGITLTSNENYKLTENSIVIADVTKNITTATITVTATATKDAKVKIAAELAKDNKNLYATGEFSADGNAVYVKPTEQTATGSVTEAEGTFIPYGSLGYKDGDTFVSVNKNEDGSFEAIPNDKTATYYAYTKAANGVMTFGVSQKDNDYQFGSWAGSNDNECGTMIIAGAYSEFVAYAKDQKNCTEQELLAVLSNAYDINVTKDAKYVKVTCNDGKTEIRVYKVKNTVNMWTGTAEHQFAVQITNVSAEEYAAAAYFVKDSSATFSDTVQYVKHTNGN